VVQIATLGWESEHWQQTFLGKALAQRIIPELKSEPEPELEHDASTNALIRRYRTMRQ